MILPWCIYFLSGYILVREQSRGSVSFFFDLCEIEVGIGSVLVIGLALAEAVASTDLLVLLLKLLLLLIRCCFIVGIV